MIGSRSCCPGVEDNKLGFGHPLLVAGQTTTPRSPDTAIFWSTESSQLGSWEVPENGEVFKTMTVSAQYACYLTKWDILASLLPHRGFPSCLHSLGESKNLTYECAIYAPWIIAYSRNYHFHLHLFSTPSSLFPIIISFWSSPPEQSYIQQTCLIHILHITCGKVSGMIETR